MKQTIRKRSLILAASVLTFVPFLFGCDTVHLQGEVTVHFYDTNEGGNSFRLAYRSELRSGRSAGQLGRRFLEPGKGDTVSAERRI
ncbi:MAG TPA: hypothetical protein PLH83_12470 [Ruminococcus sp.]|nr:hypothetical protein [Ruminococcus sp.]